MLSWFFVTLLLVVLGVGLVLGYRYYQTGDIGIALPGRWFQQRPEPRLGVSEQVMVDGRRKLVLVRRDDVEHLILTGGPVDVVIETGILPQADAGPMQHHDSEVQDMLHDPAPPVFTRQPRTLGQAVNE